MYSTANLLRVKYLISSSDLYIMAINKDETFKRVKGTTNDSSGQRLAPPMDCPTITIIGILFDPSWQALFTRI